jgi:hypothetical protein
VFAVATGPTPAGLMSSAACSGGRKNVPAVSSYSTMPPVVTAPSHSRTYRSHNPARAASCSLVAGLSAAAANKPVR